MPYSKDLATYPEEFFELARYLQSSNKKEIDLPHENPHNFKFKWYAFSNALRASKVMEWRMLGDAVQAYSVQKHAPGVRFIHKAADMQDMLRIIRQEMGGVDRQGENTGNMPRINPDDSTPSLDDLLERLKPSPDNSKE